MAFSINAPTTYSQSNFGGKVVVASIDSTHIVAVWIPSSRGNVSSAIGTISGTSVSFGTVATITTDATGVGDVAVSALSSTTFVVFWGDGNTGQVQAAIGTVSSGAISYGTVNTFGTLSSNSTSRVSVVALSATAFSCTWLSSSSVIDSTYCTISGTTITVVSNAGYTSGSGAPPSGMCALSATAWVTWSESNQAVAWSTNGSTVSVGSPVTIGTANVGWGINTISSTSVIVSWMDGTPKLNCNVITISGTTITAGTTQTSSATYSNVAYIKTLLMSSTSYIAFGAGTGGIGVAQTAILATISGGTVTFGASATAAAGGTAGYYTEGSIIGTSWMMAWANSGSSDLFFSVITNSAPNQGFFIS